MRKEKPEEPEKKENAAPEEANAGNYMAEGMCFGVAIGAALGQLLFHNPGIGVSVGLSLGMLFGLSIRKKPDAERTENGEEEKGNGNHAEN